VRIDKWLKVSRLIKRRTIANEACSGGRVTVNGKPVKAGYEVQIGDTIAIRFGDKTTTVTVTQIKDAVRKDDASVMYEIV
jgi:ribosomal 50S subunit-recycling heat shock protein